MTKQQYEDAWKQGQKHNCEMVQVLSRGPRGLRLHGIACRIVKDISKGAELFTAYGWDFWKPDEEARAATGAEENTESMDVAAVLVEAMPNLVDQMPVSNTGGSGSSDLSIDDVLYLLVSKPLKPLGLRVLSRPWCSPPSSLGSLCPGRRRASRDATRGLHRLRDLQRTGVERERPHPCQQPVRLMPRSYLDLHPSPSPSLPLPPSSSPSHSCHARVNSGRGCVQPEQSSGIQHTQCHAVNNWCDGSYRSLGCFSPLADGE